MQVKARTLGQPAANELGFVNAVVVQNKMNVQFCGHVLLDGAEKTPKFAGAMTAMQLSQHLAAGQVEGSEPTGGAVPFVVVGAAFDLSRRRGSRGAVRSNAWIWLFSSTHSTRARSGGSR